MIRILVDNNAFKELAANQKYSLIASKLEELHQCGSLCLHFSCLPLIEQITGINGDSAFRRAKPVIQFAFPLGKNGILLDPKNHLKCYLEKWSRGRILEEINPLLDMCRSLCSCNDYSEFNSTGLLANVRDDYKLQLSSLTPNKHANETIDPGDAMSSGQRGMLTAATHFDILPYVHNVSTDELHRKLPSLSYWLDCQIFYLSRLHRDGTRRPKRSAYIDIEQLVYLNICDYVLTKDRDIREIVDNCGNAELTGRAIGFDTFDALLSSPPLNLPKKAPQCVASIPLS